MPVFPCHHPTCTVYVGTRGSYCAAHQDKGPTARHERDRVYDQHRDPEARAFYNSAAWKRARRIKLAGNPWCERCLRVFAHHVHHRKPFKECTPAERVAQANLMSVCQPCHNTIEAEVAACS